MTGPSTPPKFESAAAFFAQALAIEAEARERYALFAGQMEAHNNPEAADIFRKMAEAEGQHQERIGRRAGGAPAQAPAPFRWTLPEGPETAGFDGLHYLMSPHQALQIARQNEERAAAWFEAVAQSAESPEIKALAAEMAKEEREHAGWIGEWLKKFPPPEKGWDEDYDPPAIPD